MAVAAMQAADTNVRERMGRNGCGYAASTEPAEHVLDLAAPAIEDTIMLDRRFAI